MDLDELIISAKKSEDTAKEIINNLNLDQIFDDTESESNKKIFELLFVISKYENLKNDFNMINNGIINELDNYLNKPVILVYMILILINTDSFNELIDLLNDKLFEYSSIFNVINKILDKDESSILYLSENHFNDFINFTKKFIKNKKPIPNALLNIIIKLINDNESNIIDSQIFNAIINNNNIDDTLKLFTKIINTTTPDITEQILEYVLDINIKKINPKSIEYLFLILYYLYIKNDNKSIIIKHMIDSMNVINLTSNNSNNIIELYLNVLNTLNDYNDINFTHLINNTHSIDLILDILDLIKENDIEYNLLYIDLFNIIIMYNNYLVTKKCLEILILLDEDTDYRINQYIDYLDNYDETIDKIIDEINNCTSNICTINGETNITQDIYTHYKKYYTKEKISPFTFGIDFAYKLLDKTLEIGLFDYAICVELYILSLRDGISDDDYPLIKIYKNLSIKYLNN